MLKLIESYKISFITMANTQQSIIDLVTRATEIGKHYIQALTKASYSSH